MRGIKAQKISVKKENGFLYVDVLLGVTIFLLMLPIALGLSQKTIEKAKATYEADYLVQDAIRRVEAFKGQAYSARLNQADDKEASIGLGDEVHTRFSDGPVMASSLEERKEAESDIAKQIIWEEAEENRELGGLSLEAYSLQAYDKERSKYSLTVYVYRK